MYSIQANRSGTRYISVSEENLQTIREYSLFQFLIDSNGIINELVLDKLRLNIRSLLTISNRSSKHLLDLCIDVIYHTDMKAFGLQNLFTLYEKWYSENPEQVMEENKE